MVCVLALVLVVAGLWIFTPSVDNLQSRVAASMASHDSPPAPADIATSKVAKALIATEDSRFYTNPGVDPISITRSLFAALTGNADSGAATLEQQLSKNVYTPGRGNVPAKVEQVVLGVKLDQHYSKAQIITAYLSYVYFGHGYYGVTQAAEGYFGAPADQLTWAQASMLAGLVQAPSDYDPVTHLTLAKLRQQHVLDRLAATGVLTTAEADAAATAPLGLRAQATPSN